MKTWTRQGSVFGKPIAWTATTIPGSNESYWAPDISFFNGKWHLYYSVSTFGRRRSAIGLATNVTLNPQRADYAWKDEGVVVESTQESDYNAIDPNVVLDKNQQPWLSFGSFWGGLKLIQLDAATGKPKKEAQLLPIASRPRVRPTNGAIEAPYIIRHGDYYYLFASFDLCCKAVESTYNIQVGRAKEVTGPYLDREGKPMTEGGGTLVLSSSQRWRGPGHNAVYQDGKTDWLVYHAYDAEDRGASKLHIEPITWDAEGWPRVPSSSLPAPQPQAQPQPQPQPQTQTPAP
jgi:arabinan endo-1,5-alpha-L-arabinosidase